MPKCHRGSQLHNTVMVLWKSCTLCSSAKRDLCLTSQYQLVRWSMANITVHYSSRRWGQLFTVNNQNCLSMVLVFAQKFNTSSPTRCAKCGTILGVGGIGTSSLFSRSCPIWLMVVCTCEKQLWSKPFESEDDINTAVTDSLHFLSKNEYRTATDCLPHRQEKCLYSAGNYTE
jgi:hypothetical protein